MLKRLGDFAIGMMILLCAGSVRVVAVTYEVGPGKPLAAIADVPWATLQPGDTVLIYWRATCYKEKWVICRQGTASQPILVRGIPNGNGELPVIDGNGATTPVTLDYWNQVRGIIKIGGASYPEDTMPRHIVIENLDIRGAHPPYAFTAANGSAQSYVNNAAAIYVEKVENLTIRNCILHDAGNGLFIGSSDDAVSRNILVEGNYIYDNGNQDSIYEHNNYTAAINIVFQYNRFGPLRSGCLGNNLKDRSAGLVVRYNWIESGNRQLDLVDGEDSSVIIADPSYRSTFVYGNILIEPDGAGNSQIVHYGGDSGVTSGYRKGTLYFYSNNVVSTRSGNTTLFRLSTNEESCDARNNIFYVSAEGSHLALTNESGTLAISHNWLKFGWVISHSVFGGSLVNDGTSLQTASPGFSNEGAQDFRLNSDSACINAGTSLHAASLPANAVIRQYVSHQMSEVRPVIGVLDIGAFEYGFWIYLPMIVRH
jgi:hypothetical protein